MRANDITMKQSENNYCYFSLTGLDDHFSPNQDLIDFTNITVTSQTIDNFRIHCSANIRMLVEKETTCYILGDIYNYDNPHQIFNVLNTADTIKELDGYFTLIFVGPKVIRIFSDQSCLYPVYYHAEKQIFSTIAYEIGNYLKAKPDVDDLNYYLVAKRPLPGRTLYRDIKALKSETQLIVDNSGVREKCYTHAEDFIDTNSSIHDASAKLKTIITDGYEYLKSAGQTRVLCDLSGGSDSRVTSLLAHHTFGMIQLFSKGAKIETDISKSINSQCLNNSKYYTRQAVHNPYPANAIKLVAGHKDIHYVGKKYYVDADEARSFRVKITGETGSIFKDFWVRHLGYKRLLRKTGLSDRYLDMIIRTKLLSRNPILKSYHETQHYIRNHIRSNINFKLRADKILDQIAIKYSANHNEYVSRQIGDLFFRIWSPFHSNRFITQCRRIKPKFRFYENLHSHIIYSVDKTCAKFHTDRSIFGVHPFKLVPKTSANRFYYALWDMLYDVQQISIKVFKLIQLKFKKSGTSNSTTTSIRQSLLTEIPDLDKLKDDSLIETINHCFDYLDE